MPNNTWMDILAHIFIPLVSSVVAALSAAWLYKRQSADEAKKQAKKDFDDLNLNVSRIGQNVESVKDVFSNRMDSFEQSLDKHVQISTENNSKLNAAIIDLDSKLWSLVVAKKGGAGTAVFGNIRKRSGQ